MQTDGYHMSEIPLKLHPRQLEHFLVAINHSSLRAAAEVAGLTQPALSKSLRKLEEQLGVSLFERTPRGIEPTSTARILERHAKVILADSRYAEMEIAALRKGTTGSLRIGAGLIWSLGPLPRILAGILERYPNLQVEVRAGIAGPLLPLIAAGDIDLFLGTMRALDEMLTDRDRREDLVIEPILKVEMSAFVRADHPLPADVEVTAEDLRSYPWAGFADDHWQEEELRTAFDGLGLAPPTITLRTNSIAALLAIVSQSNHVILLANVLEREALAHGLRRLTHTVPIRALETWLILRRHLTGLEPVNVLCDAIRGVKDTICS